MGRNITLKVYLIYLWLTFHCWPIGTYINVLLGNHCSHNTMLNHSHTYCMGIKGNLFIAVHIPA